MPFVSDLHIDSLTDDLYQKRKKQFPDELPFPERFNLKLTEDSFNKGKTRNLKNDTEKLVDWKGNLISEKPITVIEYNSPSRLDQAIHDSFPKSFKPLNVIHSYFYNNIEVGTSNKALDLEYNFHFYPADKRVETILMAYDTREVYTKSFYGDTLKVRIQYVSGNLNSEGYYYEIWGYIYIPKKEK